MGSIGKFIIFDFLNQLGIRVMSHGLKIMIQEATLKKQYSGTHLSRIARGPSISLGMDAMVNIGGTGTFKWFCEFL